MAKDVNKQYVLGLKVDGRFASLLDIVVSLTSFGDLEGNDTKVVKYSTRSDFLRDAVIGQLEETIEELKSIDYLKPLVEKALDEHGDWRELL